MHQILLNIHSEGVLKKAPTKEEQYVGYGQNMIRFDPVDPTKEVIGEDGIKTEYRSVEDLTRSWDYEVSQVIAGEIPSEKVYEDDTTYAFKDINPKAKVHVLVVPRKHYANVAELAAADPQQLAHMAQVAQNIADQEFHGAFRLIFNTGIDAGQTVFHVHAHVLTGEKLDE